MKPLKRRHKDRRRHATLELLEARIAPATFLVTNTNDTGAGSLRDAIQQANASTNIGVPDLISFANIPASGAFVIQPLSPLPAITEAVLIDGYTAPGTAVNTANIGTNAVLRVEIDASLQGPVGAVLTLGGSGGSTVTGLVLRGTTSAINGNGHGVSIQSDDNLVTGNFIGTDVTGTLDFGNRNAQVSVGIFSGTDTFTGNRIGGTNPADRNILSGGAFGISLSDDSVGTVIQGNLIGTDRTGTVAIPNTNTGIGGFAIDTLIGGSAPGAGNVISGNEGWGINFAGVNTTIQGNLIGLNAAGTAPLPNARSGINFSNGATSALVGGSGAGEGNIISGNVGEGIEIGSNFGDGPGDNVTVFGNKIGTDATGTIAFGNGGPGIGVYGTSNARIGGPNPGEANLIAFNGAQGVVLTEIGGSISSVTISANSIHSNAGLGIDIQSFSVMDDFFGVTPNDAFDGDTGPNGLTNWPVLGSFNNTGANLTIGFGLSAMPFTSYRVEFFSLAPSQVDVSGSGEGAVFLGSIDVTTDGFGSFGGTFAQTFGVALPLDSFFSATATELATGETSEFSPALGNADTYTWTGSQNSDWFNPLNWSPTGVPGPLDAAVFNGGANPIRLDAEVGVLNFIHGNGAMIGTGRLVVRDTFMWTGGTQDGPGLQLVPGSNGTLASGAGPLQWTAGDFDVLGRLGLGGSGLAFNAGTLTLDTAAALTLNAGIFDQDGTATTSTVINFGAITKNGTGTFGVDPVVFDNLGFVEARAGVLTLTGYTGFSGSALGLTGGGVSTGGAVTLDVDGRIFGTGVIAGNVANNSGQVFVGLGEMPGILNIAGNYFQGSAGTLDIGLRGNVAGTGYDQLQVGGAAMLDGTLNVTIQPGYAPPLGSVHDVVTTTNRTGTFLTTAGIGALTPVYAGTAAQLVRNGLNFVWDAGAGADMSWFNPQNWNPDGVPGGADVAMFNSPATILLDAPGAVVGDFIQNNGTLTGPQQLDVLGSLVWGGGVQSGAGMTFAQPGSSVLINGGAAMLDGRTLVAAGSGAVIGGASLVLDNAAQLRIGGVFAIQNTTPFQAGVTGGNVEVMPGGTLRQTAAGNLTFPAGLNLVHNGTLDVQGGTFTLLGGGAADDAIFRIAPGATLEFNSAAGFDIADGIVFEGGGTALLSGGTMGGVDAFVTVAPDTTLAVSGGTLSAANHAFTIDGTLLWSGGMLTGDGSAIINGVFDLSGTTTKTLSRWVIDIGPGASGAWSGSGNLSLEQNARVGIGGMVLIAGDLDIANGDGVGGQIELVPGGSLTKNDASTTIFDVPVANNGGIVAFAEFGTLQFDAGYTQTGGVLDFTPGATVASSTPLQIQGGLVIGSGIVTGSVNNLGGLLSPGPADGTTGALSITGDYMQGTGAELLIEAEGNTPVSQYDQLQVGGMAMLDGALTFTPINLFNPLAPSSFNVVTSIGARTGTFFQTNLPPGGSASYAANGASVVFGATGIVVTNTNDSGAGSLRQAILDANATAGVDTITFNIPGAGVQTIQPATLLPVITEAVMIDGYSQPGASANTLAVGSDAVLRIEIDGSLVPNGAGSESGLVFNGTGALTVSGLIINAFSGYGIELLTGTGSKIAGNWIGPANDGGAFANNQFGIWIDDADGAIIGGTNPADRNVISNNDGNGIEISNAASGTIIQGNYIGTNVFGTAALPNGFDGVYTQGPNTQVGGTTPGAGNVISGSAGSVGILINTASAAGSRVEGNFIGTDATGMVDLGNFSFGVEVGFTPNVTIGGTAAGAGNLIAGNGEAGVAISGAGSTGVLVLGNFIGTDVTGTVPMGNDGGGVAVFSASGVTIGGVAAGEGNVIAFNTGAGVFVDPGAGTAGGNVIRGNAIFANTGLGIDLLDAGDPPSGVTPNDPLDADGGANTLQNFPVLTSATLSAGAANVSGSLHSLPGTSFHIDFYVSPVPDGSGFGEGAVFLGDIGVTTNASGDVTFNFNPATNPPPPGSFVTAIATNQSTGDSSEFSAALAVQTSFVWDGGGGADMSWFNPLNWDRDSGVPGAADTAILNIASTINLTADVSVGVFQQSAGTLTGAGTLTVLTDFAWSGGVQSGSGSTIIDSAATLTLSGAAAKTLDTRALTLGGNTTTTSTGNLTLLGGAAITNNAFFDAQSDFTFVSGVGGGSFANTSTGTLRKSAGVGSTVWNVPFTNAGIVQPNLGAMLFTGGYTQTAGDTQLGAGLISSTTPLALQGGQLTGSGPISAGVDNTGATIRPGGTGAAGTITISGDYTQSGAGVLAVELGGTGAGQFDALAVIGTATLGGTLNIANISGFTPAGGNTFRVVQSAGNPGTFTTLTGATAGISQAADATGLVLTAAALTFIWDNSAGNGDWFNPLNWDRDSGVPGAADTAILNIASTINLTADASVGVFQQSAGTLTSGAGITFTVLSSFDWTGGTQAGAGATRLAAGSLSNFVTSSDLVFSRTIDNAGIVVWTGAANLRGQFGGTINNLDGGIFEVQTDGDFVVFGGAGSAVFNNAAGAIFRKTVATGTTQFTGQDFTFHNAGTVDMLAGTLALGFSGNHSGTFAGAPGTVIAFDAGQAFASGTQFTGAGEKRLNAGTHTFTGAIDASGLVLSGGTISGTHTLTGALEWRSGEFAGGATTLPAGSTLTLNSSSALRAAGRTFTVEGSIIHSGTGAFRGALGTVVNIAAGGLYDLQTDGGFVVFGGDGAATFNNAGTLRKSGGAGTASFSNGGQTFALNNSGAVQVQSGALLLAHAGTHSGIFDTAAGSTLTFQTSQALSSGVQFTGAGRAQITGGTTTATGAINTSNLVLAAGTLDGTHSIVGTLGWEGGQFSGATTIAEGSTLRLATATEKFLNSGTITNAGTVLWQDAGNFRFGFGATLNNQAGGLFDIQNDASILIFGGTGSGQINNAGTLRKSAGAGTTAIGGGQGPDVTNTGTVEAQSGTLAFQRSFTQTAGATVLAGGNLGGGITLAVQGGELRGAGTITGSVNNTGATVRPGGTGAAGTITISGNYSQGAGGTIEVELGGAGAGQFDVLDVGGAATLAGTLTVTTLGGFAIAPPMSFAVLPYGSHTGTFSSSLPPGLVEDYQAGALVLTTPVVLDPLVVNTTLDIVDGMDAFTSLREAVIFANGNAGADTITFAIPGSGAHTIALASALPDITDTLLLDGSSQPGSADTEAANSFDAIVTIFIDGAGVAGGANGLTFAAGSSGSAIASVAVQGFKTDVNGSGGFGIVLASDGNVVTGSIVGGAAEDANGGGGILVTGMANTIGGSARADRNLISGNAGAGVLLNAAVGTQIENNLIGTNAAGSAALANANGVELATGSTQSLITGNVISGNVGAGVFIQANGGSLNVVTKNVIGADATNTSAVPNATGVRVGNDAINNTIGGPAAGAGNTIAFNTGNGVQVEGAGALGIAILGNTIHGNGGLGIDLANDGVTANDADDSDTGPNNLINFPVLTAASLSGTDATVDGTVTANVTGTVRIEFFLASTGVFLGAQDVPTVAGTAASFAATLAGIASGEQIVATTSDLSIEGTSELSAPVTVIPPTLISIGDAAIVEGNSGTRQLVFTLTLDMAVPVPVTVQFSTGAFSGDARSADEGADYVGVAGGVATFAPNELTTTVAITINGDTASEPVERFNVVLGNPNGAGLGDATGTGAILDEDHDTFAVGEGSGNKVSVFTATPAGAVPVQTIEAFTPGYKGGVRVAVGDVTGDGVDDIIAGAGLGGRAKVRVFDGVTFAPVPGVLGEFSAFGRSYRGGVFVAAGDVNGDGFADVIVTPSAGSSNRVNIFSGADGSLLSSFRAFGKGTGGVRVAAGDVNGDGFADIIAGTGVGSSVRVFDAMTGAIVAGDGHEFRAFGKNFRGGVYVAAGDLNADGRDDLIVGTGAGQPLVRTYLQDVGGVQPKTFDAYTGKTLRGVRVTALDIDADGIADIITSKGRKGDNLVRTFDGETFATLFETRPFASQLDSLYVG